MERKVEVLLKNGKYGVVDNTNGNVPFVHDNPVDAISEWEYFERLNTSEVEYRRFLSVVTPIEFIDEIIKQYGK